MLKFLKFYIGKYMNKIFLIIVTSLQLLACEAYISVDDLLEELKSSNNIVILDVTDKDEYEQGHIPGAISANISQFRHNVILHKEIKSPKEIQRLARSLGINNDSKVIIYGHGKKKELLKTSYMAMAFITHGLNNIALLDGGFDEWNYDNINEVSTLTPKVVQGNFTANFQNGIIVDKEYVRTRIGKVPMLDARPPRYYFGSKLSGGVERYGHIPNAISSFWGDKFKNDKTIRDEDVLEEIMIIGNKISMNDEIILYCTGGLETSANWYILYQHLGFKNAKIYDGSMRDWGNVRDTPLTRYKWESVYSCAGK